MRLKVRVLVLKEPAPAAGAVRVARVSAFDVSRTGVRIRVPATIEGVATAALDWRSRVGSGWGVPLC